MRVEIRYGDESPYFRGELMTCVLCARSERSDPDRESNWRVIEADGVPFLVCPCHFPPDGAPASAFRAAYLRVLAVILTGADPSGEGGGS